MEEALGSPPHPLASVSYRQCSCLVPLQVLLVLVSYRT